MESAFLSKLFMSKFYALSQEDIDALDDLPEGTPNYAS
jgi:hypothetical protein